MQNKSVRIRTTPGQDKNINVELNQDFDFLEILSLKISQDDLYNTFCADYGVIVGRVIANGGFGVPNAKVSVFIPISSEDEKNNLIKELYPYKLTSSVNGEGYRYNLFLNDVSCSINTSIGSFPKKKDVINNDIQLEIFKKYYKYTTKTNEAGDYILFGVPTGQQVVHTDVDLSDIGILSLRPYELIDQGFNEKLFKSQSRYRASTNLEDLPQVKSQDKGIDVVPFWGDTDSCSFGITRVDFSLSTEIIPSSVFIGSVFTDTKKNALSKRCNPKNDMGKQCELDTRNGSIDILRVMYDEFDHPTDIQKFTPRAGKDLIDEDGTYSFSLPMYYGKVVTDEFGNLVASNDAEKGVPTKGKYRFKLKFNEPTIIKKRNTASLIVPTLNRIHGGTEGTEQQRWTDDIGEYDIHGVNNHAGNVGTVFGNIGIPFAVSTPSPGGIVTNAIPFLYPIEILTPYSIVEQDPELPLPKTVSSDLDLDFHTFEWKQVYTLSQYIKKVKRGNNRFSFLGIKSCDECDYNNYFPFTTALKKTSFNFGLQRIFINFISFILKILIILGNLRFCMFFKFLAATKCLRILDAAPFGFIKNGLENAYPDGFPLTCGDEEYFIDPSCGFDGCVCDGDPLPANDDMTSSTPCCPDKDGTNCTTSSCFSFNVLVPKETNCSSLNQLENWKCCAILDSARENQAIRFSFFDAWINGTAYLFQYKTKVKYKADGTTKAKFCGPGSTNVGGNNYTNYTTARNILNLFDYFKYTKNTCSKGQCLILGPSIDENDRSYVGGTKPSFSTSFGTGYPATSTWYNPQSIVVPDNSPGIPNGANDANEFIYCNWASSTKIVGLGPIDMCEDVFSGIRGCISKNDQNLNNSSTINCSISDLRLGDKINPYTGDNWGPLSPYELPHSSSDLNGPPYVVKVGTGGESGFDRQETTKKLTETSYQDPEAVLIYLLRQEDCDFGKLFLNPAEIGTKCHEIELYPEYQEVVRQVCREHNTIVTVPEVNPDGDLDFDNPEVWDVTGIASTIDPDDVDGPFEVDDLLYNRYNPNQIIDPSNDPTSIPNVNRGHIDTRTNMPYFYFGLRPGKSAIDKFRDKYLL
jgi:hypothetical protein